MFYRWPGELDATQYGPFEDDVGELVGAAVGLECGDLVEGGDGLGEALLVDGFAGGPVVPCVEGVDPGLGGGAALRSVSNAAHIVFGSAIRRDATSKISTSRALVDI